MEKKTAKKINQRINKIENQKEINGLPQTHTKHMSRQPANPSAPLHTYPQWTKESLKLR